MQPHYWVYFLWLERNRTFYTGVTNDLQRRLWEHQNKISSTSYVSRNLPCRLVWSQAFDRIEEAIAAEKQLKSWSQAKKRALVERKFELLPVLARGPRAGDKR